MSAYRNIMVKVGVVLAFAMAFAMAAPTKAEASFVAYICDDPGCVGGGDIIVADGGGGDGSAGVNGIINTSGVVGGMTFVLNLSQSKPALAQPSMDLNFVATSGAAGGHVWLYATDTDFNVISPVTGSLDGNFSGSGSVQGTIYGLVDNTQGTLASPVSTPVLNTSPFHAVIAHAASPVSPYSMTIGVEIIRTSAGTTTGDFLIVPEPASLVLLGMGLLGAGAASRRRQRKS